MSNSIFIKKATAVHSDPSEKQGVEKIKQPVTEIPQEFYAQLKTLTDFQILEGLKKGHKLRSLINFNDFWDQNQNLDLVLSLNQKVKELTEKMSLAGLINAVFSKQYSEIVVKVEKSFKTKQNVIDFSSALNQKRLLSVLKLLIYVLNSARFFKEDAVFSEGKWWKIRDEQFLHQLERKIHAKCEALLENYENVIFIPFSYYKNGKDR